MFDICIYIGYATQSKGQMLRALQKLLGETHFWQSCGYPGLPKKFAVLAIL